MDISEGKGLTYQINGFPHIFNNVDINKAIGWDHLKCSDTCPGLADIHLISTSLNVYYIPLI